MPRIFKGSESTLRLLISKTGDYQALTEIKIKLYTTDIENAIEIIDGIKVCKNIAIITLAPRAFMGMEDGLINYIIDGATEDDVFHTERQSNYMLKSLSYINEDGVATQTMTIESNGEYRVTPNDGLYVDINVNVPDLNGSYDDGFNAGYDQGKTDGVNEQKSKLESINITENGTYTKEDGYNHIEVNVPDLNGSYDEGHRDGEQAGYNSGYTQGQTDVAAKARVLEVTKNGNYLSKYSDPILPEIVTGVYADGTDFYNYAELSNQVYNTNITVTQDSVVELWYKGDNESTDDGWNTIFGCAKNDDDNFYLGYMYTDTTNLRGRLGQEQVQFSWDNNVWHHIIMKNDGLWIDDTLIGSFNTTKTFAYNLGLNGTWDGLIRSANGTFGMIKIDNTIIIPTADGFQNVNTGELIEVVKNGVYTFTENKIIYGEGELYKTINVNVIPKINVKEAGIKFSNSTFTEVPEWADFEGVTDLSAMFGGCKNIKTIPSIDTTQVTEMNDTFSECSNLETIPLIDTSKVTTMKNTFWFCTKLSTFPPIDTSSVVEMDNVFWNCTGLTSLPAFNMHSLNMYSFYGVFGGSDLPNLTDFGGFLNLKLSLTSDKNLQRLPNLTYESCINVLNGLYDFTGNGEVPNSEQGQLKVHQNFLDTVGDEISIGTAKGWSISA